jgi:hypothetical protein
MQEVVNCQRCGLPCRLSGPPGKKAKMLRFSEGPGLCVNCAVHDWLRNTYPPNILLAQSGPKVLLVKHIQEQFTEIMQIGFADAKPDEIDWNRIVENWDLPFRHKMKPSAMNPCTQKELDEIAEGKRPGLGQNRIPEPDPLDGKLTITSFEELNELSPGLGDNIRKCIRDRNES